MCGYLITRFFLILVSRSKATTGRKVGFFFSLVTTDLIEEAVAEDKEMRVNIKGVRVYPADESDPNAAKDDAAVPKGDQEVSPAINAEADNAPVKAGENLEVYDAGNTAEKKNDAEGQKVHDEAAAAAKAQENAPNYPGSKVEGMYVINEVYRYLGVIASFTMCMSHGSNDVANSISPLLVVQQTHAKYLGEPNDSKIGYWVGGVGIAFGIILLGERVMITLARKSSG